MLVGLLIVLIGPVIGYMLAHYITWWVGQHKMNNLRKAYDLEPRPFEWISR